MQFKIYDIVRKSRYGITGPRLVDKVYADRPDGGPEQAARSVHTMILAMNNRLKPAGLRVGATNRGRGGSYKLVALTTVSSGEA